MNLAKGKQLTSVLLTKRWMKLEKKKICELLLNYSYILSKSFQLSNFPELEKDFKNVWSVSAYQSFTEKWNSAVLILQCCVVSLKLLTCWTYGVFYQNSLRPLWLSLTVVVFFFHFLWYFFSVFAYGFFPIPLESWLGFETLKWF